MEAHGLASPNRNGEKKKGMKRDEKDLDLFDDFIS